MCGIERAGSGIVTARILSANGTIPVPVRSANGVLFTRVGSAHGIVPARVLSANGAVSSQPGATPQVHVHPFHQGPTARPIADESCPAQGVASPGWNGPLALDIVWASVPGALPQAGMGAHLWCWGTGAARDLEQTSAANGAEILEA